MLFVQDDSEVFLFSSAHWLLLSLSAVAEGRANGAWLSHLYENAVVNVISGGVCRGRTQIQRPFKRRSGINLKVSRDHFG